MIDILAAVLIDFLIGDPYSFPHPVRLMGRLIHFEETLARRFSKDNGCLKVSGLIVVVFNILLAFIIPFYILGALKKYGVFYHIVNVYLLYISIAAGCLHREGAKIYRALGKSLDEARHSLSFIVGRDTENLVESEVIRAAVETVAENTSDGVIAPLLYAMAGGVPMAMAYKMVNTMDSMLGYMNEKYRYIGFFPAKTDDLFNYIPARLTGFLMCLSSFLRFNWREGLKIMIKDRKNHKSPNCAYPEGAAAGLLGVQLGGDNVYFGEIMKKPRIGDKKRELVREDINRAVEIMYRAEILMVLSYMVLMGVAL